MKNKRKVLVNSVVTCLIISIAGCASIFSKNSFPVTIKSTTDGAHFVIRDTSGGVIHAGETPATVTLTSSKGYFQSANYTVVFSKDGYKDQSIPLSSSISGWYWGNILLGGAIGMLIVDPLTGSMWKLPDNVAATLSEQDPKIGLENGVTPQLQIVAMDQVPDELRAQLVQLK